MKLSKGFIVVYILLIHLLACFAIYNLIAPKTESPIIQLISPPPVTTYDSKRKELFKEDSHADEKGLVFLGDSLTMFLPSKTAFPESRNLGIGGDTAGGLASRLGDYKLNNAKSIVLQIGTNDLFTLENDFDKLNEAIPQSPFLYWYAVPPLNITKETLVSPSKIQELNKHIRSLCEKRQNCKYIDITQEYADRNGKLRQDLNIGDGVHLNEKGYEIWLSSLKQILSK